MFFRDSDDWTGKNRTRGKTLLSRGKAQYPRLNRMLALSGFMHGGWSEECESFTMKLANGGGRRDFCIVSFCAEMDLPGAVPSRRNRPSSAAEMRNESRYVSFELSSRVNLGFSVRGKLCIRQLIFENSE